MLSYQIVFLHERKLDKRVGVGAASLKFRNEKEYKETSDDTKIAILKHMGFDIVRLVKPEENLIRVNFRRDKHHV